MNEYFIKYHTIGCRNHNYSRITHYTAFVNSITGEKATQKLIKDKYKEDCLITIDLVTRL